MADGPVVVDPGSSPADVTGGSHDPSGPLGLHVAAGATAGSDPGGPATRTDAGGAVAVNLPDGTTAHLVLVADSGGGPSAVDGGSPAGNSSPPAGDSGAIVRHVVGGFPDQAGDGPVDTTGRLLGGTNLDPEALVPATALVFYGSQLNTVHRGEPGPIVLRHLTVHGDADQSGLTPGAGRPLPDGRIGQPHRGDRVLLATSGLDRLDAVAVQRVLAAARTPREAVDGLLDLAREAGVPLTVTVADVVDA
ncbi:MAG: hypothetical protein ACQSGP_14700, partial [Frankia sp.]